jgi:hypothetical protein
LVSNQQQREILSIDASGCQNKENKYEQFVAWKREMKLKGTSEDPKDASEDLKDGSSLLRSRGLVFQNVSNCNIVMVLGQIDDAGRVLKSLGRL